MCKSKAFLGRLSGNKIHGRAQHVNAEKRRSKQRRPERVSRQDKPV
jgi:hypothetical protein